MFLGGHEFGEKSSFLVSSFSRLGFEGLLELVVGRTPVLLQVEVQEGFLIVTAPIRVSRNGFGEDSSTSMMPRTRLG